MRIYVVIPTIEIVDSMIEEAIESPYSIRKSLDGSLAILKFNTSFPNSMGGYLKYTHAEILQYLTDNKASWEEEV